MRRGTVIVARFCRGSFVQPSTVRVVLGVFALASSLSYSLASAQPQAAEGARPSVAAVRIDTAEAPEIDGDLSDAAWAKANTIENFRQLEPMSGAPATQRTTVHILYDE